MEMLIYFSSRTLAPAHSTKTTSKWFADHDITVVDWPVNMPDLKPIWNLGDIFKRKVKKQWIQQYRRAEGSMVPQKSHRLIASMAHLTNAGICAKGALTNNCVHKLTYFKELVLFCFANPFFLIGNIQIF